jgi:hypothetical protein
MANWSWTTDETGLDDDTPCPYCGEEACEGSCTGAILADDEEEDEA